MPSIVLIATDQLYKITVTYIPCANKITNYEATVCTSKTLFVPIRFALFDINPIGPITLSTVRFNVLHSTVQQHDVLPSLCHFIYFLICHH